MVLWLSVVCESRAALSLEFSFANISSFVSGAVSGPKGCVVRIQDAIKKPWPEVPQAKSAEPATA
jgi:hypothetical protein